MNYYGIVREIYKNNGKMPYETIIMPNLFKDEEKAFKWAMHDSDSTGLRHGYKWAGVTTQVETRHNSKTGKDIIYRHEWHVVKFNMEEGE